MVGLIFEKLGMVTTFDKDGLPVAATLLYSDGNVILQKKTRQKEGYDAVALGFGTAKEKNKSKSFVGICKKAKSSVKAICREIRDFFVVKTVGQIINISDLFNVGDIVSVCGLSKGKGFQGVVKRHGFAGVGGRTHGQHNRERHPGSIGASSFPSRVLRGMRMAGQMGRDRVTVRNLEVLEIDLEENFILVKGSIPGSKGSFVIVKK